MSQQKLLAALAIATLLPAGAAMAQSFGAQSYGGEATGVATWYGQRGVGRHTASGEAFDEEAMTAASNRLPLGARVRVTVADTGESVVVRVNDRMGSPRGFLDLTKGAARQIGLLGRGRALVSVAPSNEEPVEVAEASEDETSDIGDDLDATPSPVHHSARHLRPAVHLSRGLGHLVTRVILAGHTTTRRPSAHRV